MRDGAFWRGYLVPRRAMALRLGERAGPRGTDARAHLYLFAACAIGALATLPEAMRNGSTFDPEARGGVVPAHLFAYLFVAPLIAYVTAAALHLAARGFGGRARFAEARMALFWSLLLGAPIALAVTALELAAPIPATRLVVLAASASWLWLLAANLAEAEGFGTTARVAAVLIGALALIVVSLNALTGGELLAHV